MVVCGIQTPTWPLQPGYLYCRSCKETIPPPSSSCRTSLRLQKCHHAPDANYTQRVSHWDNDIWLMVWEEKGDRNFPRELHMHTDVMHAVAGGGQKFYDKCADCESGSALISAAKNGTRSDCGSSALSGMSRCCCALWQVTPLAATLSWMFIFQP